MTEIHLKRASWFFDASRLIGSPGGFGAVYHGQSPAGVRVAIKRLHLGAVESAHRELRVADLLGGKSFSHVISVLDSGEDENTGSYFIVMPVATESLQDLIDRQASLPQKDAQHVLLQICEGLEEMAEFVHRDLKPGNILLHDEKWKIADFGIAKFVEESTSLQTLKDCLTAPYAAPEQWMYQRSTTATDLYALGCIAFQLLSGFFPFSGPSMDDFREQHIMKQPPALHLDIDPQMRTIVGMLLRKAPESRPNLKRTKELLATIKPQQSNAVHPLAQAAARLEQAYAKEASEAAAAKEVRAARQRLVESGRDILLQTMERLKSAVFAQAVTAREDAQDRLQLGAAYLTVPTARDMHYLGAMPEHSLPRSSIDILSLLQIGLRQDQPSFNWSCSLLYGKLPNSSDYRWYEVGFMKTMGYDENTPFSLSRSNSDAYAFSDFDLALSRTMHVYSCAFGPVPIDDECTEDFIDRWTHLFALAAEGKLKHPQGLPLMGRFWEQKQF